MIFQSPWSSQATYRRGGERISTGIRWFARTKKAAPLSQDRLAIDLVYAGGIMGSLA